MASASSERAAHDMEHVQCETGYRSSGRDGGEGDSQSASEMSLCCWVFDISVLNEVTAR